MILTFRGFGWTAEELWIGLQTETACTCSESCNDDNCQPCADCRATFYWVDGSQETFRNWSLGEPSVSGTATVLRSDGGWGVRLNVNVLRRYICESGKCHFLYNFSAFYVFRLIIHLSCFKERP